MKLSPNVGSDRSWVWNVPADYSEGEPSAETLAIRFGNSDSESAWNQAFDSARGFTSLLLSRRFVGTLDHRITGSTRQRII
jgi:Ran-binding protein 1